MSNGPPGLAESRRGTPIGPPSKSKAQIARELDREITRKTRFDGRQDVSDDRLDRSKIQRDEYVAFKNDPTKTRGVNIIDPVTGKTTGTVTNLFQAATPGGKTLAEKEMELAQKYGPTMSEIAGDITYRGGKIIGAVGEKALSGGLGFLAVVNEIINYGNNKATTKYNKLNDVEKEIYNNPDKHPLTSKNLPSLKEIAQSTDLINKAEKDALGLELDRLIAEREFRFNNPTVDMRRPIKEELDPIDIGYVESGQFKKDLETAGILSLDDPTTQEPLIDSTKIPGTDITIGEYKEELKNRNYNDFQITGIINEITRRIIAGEDVTAPIENIGAPVGGASAPGGREEEFRIDPIDQPIDITTDAGDRIFGSQMVEDTPSLADTQSGYKSLEFDDILGRKSSEGTQVTAFNNPVNLTDVGQKGTTGETYGNNFAVFPNAELGIAAAKNDLRIKTDRYDGNVDKIIGEFSPREDNPDSFDNYVNFVKQGVGDRVDPGEEDELLKRVIQFENKPDVAQQYLALVAEGGLMDKKMYGGIIASKK